MESKQIDIILQLFVASLALISSVSSQDPNDCYFDVAGGVASPCNLMMDMESFAVAGWRTGTGEGAYFIGGPTIDGNQNPTGGYAFTTTTDMIQSSTPHKKSWMLTAIDNSTGGGGRCVSFAYSMEGLSVESFEVLLISFQTENAAEAMENSTVPLQFKKTRLWTQRDTTDSQWKDAQVSFSALGEYSIAFAGQPSLRYSRSHGYIAVDNIKFKDGPCDSECKFDLGTCSWTNDDTADDFDWKLGRSSNKRGTGPTKDQASFLNSQIVTGGYAYIDSGYPRRSGDTARLVSPLLNDTTTPVCIKFWLNMHGGGIGDIRLLYSPDSNSNATTELWKLGKDSGGNNFGTDSWYPCQQTVSSPEPFRLIFEASVGFPNAGDIALDTISFAKESCPSVPPGSNNGWGDCNFLDSLCGWTISSSSSSSASCKMLDRVAENSYNPPGHTWNDYSITDLYMRFDLGCYVNQAREKATLISRTFDAESTQCLSFWTYMYTTVATQTKFGALSVVMIKGDAKTTIWRLQNQQQARWTHAQVTIPKGTSMKIAFQGTKGPNVIGMIAVDDIAVYGSDCQVEPPQASAQPADCTFDDGPCLYTVNNPELSSDSPAQNWRFAKDDALQVLRDHTFEADQGGFMYVDSLNTDIKSNLKSPFLALNTTYCFTFYFASFYRDNAAKLSVYKETGGTPELLWVANQAMLPPRPTTNQQVKWHYAQILLDQENTEYKVYIEGAVRVGGWAIDDIKLFVNPDECKTRPGEAEPS